MPRRSMWGCASATIHCGAFDCVIITRRRGFVSRRWETTILRGNPVENCPILPFGTVSYLPHLTRDRVLAVHCDVVDYINELGEQGATLYQAFDTVTLHLAIQRFIEKHIEIHEETSEDNEPLMSHKE
jgi:hypothetical protein